MERDIEEFLDENEDCFFEEDYEAVESMLLNASNIDYERLLNAKLRKPMSVLLISIFLGMFGVDRFYIGDWKMGLIKLVTCAICPILWIIDIFRIKKVTKRNNLLIFKKALYSKIDC